MPPGAAGNDDGALGTKNPSAPGTDPQLPELSDPCWDSGDNVFWDSDEEFRSCLEPWHEAYEDIRESLMKAQRHLRMAHERRDGEWIYSVRRQIVHEVSWWNRTHLRLKRWLEEVRSQGSTQGLRPCPLPSAVPGARVKQEAKEDEEEEIDEEYLKDIAEVVDGNQSFYGKKRAVPRGSYLLLCRSDLSDRSCNRHSLACHSVSSSNRPIIDSLLCSIVQSSFQSLPGARSLLRSIVEPLIRPHAIQLCDRL